MMRRAVGVGALWVASGAALLAALAGYHGARSLFSLDACVPALALHFGVTPLAAPLLALLGVLGASVGVWSCKRGEDRDITLIAAFASAMLFVLLARDAVSFLIAWEMMSLLSALLVGRRARKREVRRATLLYLAMTQGGTFCVLAALSLLSLACGGTSFDRIAEFAPQLPVATRDLAAALALLGFGSKAGLVPLHVWLPRAHPVAPANASALLSGMMLNVALYGLLLFSFALGAFASPAWGVVLLGAGLLSALVGVLHALVERDMKRALAYSSVENVGAVVAVLGVALMVRAAGDMGLLTFLLAAALLRAIAHGLFKGLLFLAAGTVHETTHTVDLAQLGGLREMLPWTAPAFLVGCVTACALPPFLGFAATWLGLRGIILASEHGGAFSLLLILGIAGLALTDGIALACFVRLFGVAFLGKSRRLSAAEPVLRERFDAGNLATGLLAALCAVLGMMPFPLLAAVTTAASGVTGSSAIGPIAFGAMPLALSALPLLGVLATTLFDAMEGVRLVPTWTCGSEVTPRSQYTASAFSNPLRLVFRRVAAPERERATTQWLHARLLRAARGARAVQNGDLRLYIAYIIATVVTVLAVLR